MCLNVVWPPLVCLTSMLERGIFYIHFTEIPKFLQWVWVFQGYGTFILELRYGFFFFQISIKTRIRRLHVLFNICVRGIIWEEFYLNIQAKNWEHDIIYNPMPTSYWASLIDRKYTKLYKKINKCKTSLFLGGRFNHLG